MDHKHFLSAVATMILLALLLRTAAPCWSSNNLQLTQLVNTVAEITCERNRSIEYDHLGEFDATYWRCTPEGPDALEPRLVYYDPKHQSKPLELPWDGTDFSALGNIKEWPTTVLVFTHGFVDSITRKDSTEWMDPARQKLVNRGKAVILFDWSSGADSVYNYALGNFYIHFHISSILKNEKMKIVQKFYSCIKYSRCWTNAGLFSCQYEVLYGKTWPSTE